MKIIMYDERGILCLIRRNIKMEWKDIVGALHVDFGKHDVQRILVKHPNSGLIFAKRALPTPDTATGCLVFALLSRRLTSAHMGGEQSARNSVVSEFFSF